MIVDTALTEGQWLLYQAVQEGLIDEHADLPDAVEAALHADLTGDDLEKAGGSADHLRRYWAHGKGGEKIGWGSHGDFMRCVARVSKYMDTDQAKGYCNLRHKEATGKYPAQGHGARKAVVLTEFEVTKRDYVRDSHGRFATVAGGPPTSTTPGTEFTADGVPIAPPATTGLDRKAMGDGYVPMAPDFEEWDSGLQDAYVDLASGVADEGLGVQRVFILGKVDGLKRGMSDEEAGIYATGIARRAISASRQSTSPIEDHARADYLREVDRVRSDGTVMIAMTPEAAKYALGEGRIKSQFETGTSNGMLNFEQRAAAEVEMFGHAPNVPPNLRTVYGYVAVPGTEMQRSVSQYGSVRVALKPGVRERTTMTVGDSLSTYAKPIPLTGHVGEADKIQARSVHAFSGYSSGLGGGMERWSTGPMNYVEAQVHGGVKASDIDRIYLRKPDPGAWSDVDVTLLVQRAEGLGIPIVWTDSNGAPISKAVSDAIATRSDGATLHLADGEAGFGEPLAYVVHEGVTYEPRPLRAILARGEWVETAVAKRTYVRDSIGRFATHSGMRVGDTQNDEKAQANLLDEAAHFDALPADLQAKMVDTAASMGATRESLEREIDGCLDRAITRTGNPPRGHDWYEQAHGQAADLGKETGLSTEQTSSMIAAISPQMAWAPNLAVARYAAENRDAPVDLLALSKPITKRMPKEGGGNEQVTRTAYEWASIEVANGGKALDKQHRTMPPLASLDGKRMSDLDPYVAAALLKGHAQVGVGVFNGKPLGGKALSVADDITGKVSKVNFPPTLQTARALRIARGEDANLILNGHKVRSFRNNIARPTADDGDVTVDSHAVSLALGRKVSSSSPEYKAFATKPGSATLGVSGSYALWADAYRSVAKRRGLRVQQLQSITWIQWRHEHPDGARVTHAMD